MSVSPNFNVDAPETRTRIQGKHWCLTWPQSSFSIEEALEHFRGLRFASRSPTEVIICEEFHADGAAHRHAYIRYNDKFDLRVANFNFFDYQGRHPNIQVARNPAAWKNYVRKDGTFLAWTEDGEDADESANLFTKAGESTYQDYFEFCRRQQIPFGYARNAWDTTHSDVAAISYDEDPNPFLMVPMEERLSAFQFSESLTNVIIGPTGCGKTVKCLREMPKPLLFVTHIDQLKLFDRTRHRSILFDDMNFSHLHREAQIHLVDRQLPRAIHIRYGTALIPPGITVTVTCNAPPFNQFFQFGPTMESLGCPIERRCNKLSLL